MAMGRFYTPGDRPPAPRPQRPLDAGCGWALAPACQRSSPHSSRTRGSIAPSSVRPTGVPGRPRAEGHWPRESVGRFASQAASSRAANSCPSAPRSHYGTSARPRPGGSVAPTPRSAQTLPPRGPRAVTPRTSPRLPRCRTLRPRPPLQGPAGAARGSSQTADRDPATAEGAENRRPQKARTARRSDAIDKGSPEGCGGRDFLPRCP